MRRPKPLPLIAAACLALAGPAGAQSGDAGDHSGPLSWSYECKEGTNCPTDCLTGGDKELFSTSNYRSLTITRFPNKVVWIRIDSGKGSLDYIMTAVDQLFCRMSNAILTGTKFGPPAQPEAPLKQ